MAYILLIDDDEDLRRELASTLKRAGHEVADCSDGALGMERFTSRRPDAVLTDIVMAGTEGIETLRLVGEADPTVPVIVMSGNDMYLHLAESLGAAATILKPFRADRLLNLLDQQVGVLTPAV